MTLPSSFLPLVDDAALRQRLLVLARRWLHPADHAEDVVHDLWLQAANDALPPQLGSREAWLVTALRHRCIDQWRQQQRHQRLLQQWGDAVAPQPFALSPERQTEQTQQVAQALQRLIQTLTPDEVAAFLLHEVFDLAHAALAEMTGRNEAASRQQQRRLRQRLQSAPWAAQPRSAEAQASVDEDDAMLLALCQRSLQQRDPAALIAILRTTHPQALRGAMWGATQATGASLAAKTASQWATAASSPSSPSAQVLQLGNTLVLLTECQGETVWLPLGDVYLEADLAGDLATAG